MYRNIVFDLGGVMVDWNPRDYLMERFMRAEIEELVYNITFGSDTWHQLDAGLVSRYEGNQRMLQEARAAGRVFEVQEVIDDWVRILRPRFRMGELVRRLKRNGYAVYYLSNIASDTLEYLMEHYFDGLFDGGVASCEIHINKPDPRIYQELLQRYKLRAKECIFVDDSRPNVQAAIEQGMTGIPMPATVTALTRNLASCGVRLPR